MKEVIKMPGYTDPNWAHVPVDWIEGTIPGTLMVPPFHMSVPVFSEGEMPQEAEQSDLAAEIVNGVTTTYIWQNEWLRLPEVTRSNNG